MASEEAEAAAPSAFEVWNDYDPSMRFVTAYPMTAAQGTESSTIAYFAFEPGQHSGLHADDAEELIYVADGEGEVFVSGIQQRLEAGGFIFIPKGVEHDIYAYGDVTLRLLSFYPERARREPLHGDPAAVPRPRRSRRTWPCRARCRSSRRLDFDDLPPGLAEQLGVAGGRRARATRSPGRASEPGRRGRRRRR